MTLHKFGTLKLAGQLMIINAGLHAIAPLLSGFSRESLGLISIAVLYGIFAWALLRETRWLAYLVFLLTVLGTIVAYAKLGASTIPDIFLWALLLIDLAVAVTLFVQIWRRV